MSFDFDREISRAGTHSVKWDGRAAYFGREDVIPLWVADMDFAAPQAVTEALQARAAHPIYGYTQFPDELYVALMSWLQRRHDWQIEREWIVMAPGVVPSLYAAVAAFSQAGDGVIVQPPVYFPFMSCVTETGRKLIENPLKLERGRYSFDLEHFEQCAAQGVRLLLLCSPHNPVGRVWSAQELHELLAIARRYDVLVLSDEIHADLLYPGNQHIPLARLQGASDNVITTVAPSKTFNIPGLGLSALIVPNPAHRAAINKAFGLLHVSPANPFSITAFIASYNGGEPWLDALMAYLATTRDAVREFLQTRLPQIQLIEAEGTYMLWLDCRKLAMSDKQLKEFFVLKAGVGLSPGIVFGEVGSGFMRMNIAAPRKVIMHALERIADSLD
ncbi:MAG: MalY/PatB family protein [Methylophilaceae bacterium]